MTETRDATSATGDDVCRRFGILRDRRVGCDVPEVAQIFRKRSAEEVVDVDCGTPIRRWVAC
jgi:hypothetical protein